MKHLYGLTMATLMLAAPLVYGGTPTSEAARANSIQQFLLNSTVTGDIRNYYFNQIFSGSSVPNRWAYSLGGMLKVQTASL
ncbi:hypothetical protein HAP97_08305, partial [Acidithiobacillus caldus]|nr:hypothetical protein [Acidithiobacillus caldus]